MTVFGIVIDGAAQHGADGFAAGVAGGAEGGFAVVGKPDLQPFRFLRARFLGLLPCRCAVWFILITHVCHFSYVKGGSLLALSEASLQQ